MVVAAGSALVGAGTLGGVFAGGKKAIQGIGKSLTPDAPTIIGAKQAAAPPQKLGESLAKETLQIGPAEDILQKQLQAAFAGLQPFQSLMPIAFAPRV